jgi:HAE1 family hydrophobic/amphiphilic exporter-1
MNIAEVCVKRPVFPVMLVGFLLVMGIFSFRDLSVDLFPKADQATVTVYVQLPGATPEEVLTQVTLPLEDAVSTVSGLDELNSGSDEGISRITCTFVLERDLESAAQDVREKVAAALGRLPPNILPPVIQKADPDSDPVLTMVVAGKGSLRETTEIADKQIKRALQTVDGVGAVNLYGGRPRQIRIFADAEKLNAYGIGVLQLQLAIQRANVELPGGRFTRGKTEMNVRTLGRIEASSQFGDIIVASVNGAPIHVNDLGRVEDSYPDPTSWNMLHGQEAVALAVQRQSGTNTIQIIEAVKKKVEEMKKSLPPGITVQVVRDNSIFIKASITALEEHLLLGSLLASLVVMLFIRNIRSVLIASVAIPTSIIATFTLLKVMDFTLNNMTLLALTLAVGIVIDDAIVVLENIVRYIEEKHYEPKQAAIEGTKEIMLAVMATTLSLVIIFLPIAFTTGYARRYLNQFGWTMAFSVMVSMLVSFTLTPMLCSRLLKRIADKRGEGSDSQPPRAKEQEHSSKDSRFFQWLDRTYGGMLNWSLNHRSITLLVALGTFALTFPLNALVGRDFIPADDQSELMVNFVTPIGSSLEANAEIASAMAAKIEHLPGVEFVNPSITNLGNEGRMYVRLVDLSKRKLSNSDIAGAIRKTLAEYRDVETRVAFPSSLGGGGGSSLFGGIRIQMVGPDFYRVADFAEQLGSRMRKIPGLSDVNVDVSLNKPELQVKLDRQRASDLGVEVADVASAVRLLISGTDQISTYKEENEQYDVTMQLLPEQQRNPAVLSRVMLPSTKVGQVRLDNIATIQRGYGPTVFDRTNRQFRVNVSANNAPDFPLDVAVKAIREEIAKEHLPLGYGYRFTGTVKQLDETTGNLIKAFLLASIFMYMVLAAQFDSFLHPFVIMLSLPVSIPFALLTLWLTHRTLNLWSALGVFLLVGIVKKNGILQVDYTNRLREQGVPLREAIVQANHVRLRPILMTTLSIVAGLIPTAIGIGAGAAQRSAIAVTIIGGQSLCLLLTLLVTPVAYSLFAELEERRAFATLQAGLAKLRLGVARVFTMHVR